VQPALLSALPEHTAEAPSDICCPLPVGPEVPSQEGAQPTILDQIQHISNEEEEAVLVDAVESEGMEELQGEGSQLVVLDPDHVREPSRVFLPPSQVRDNLDPLTPPCCLPHHSLCGHLHLGPPALQSEFF
jgi:hypothetical protein